MKTTTSASLRNAQLAGATQNDPRWASIVAREPAADGKFYYSVKTTGVYCRPSCAARLGPAGERPVSRDTTRRRKGGVPSLQTLQA